MKKLSVIALGLSSMDMESALAGVPTFHFNSANLTTHDFARRGRCISIFTDPGELKKTVKSVIYAHAVPQATERQPIYRIIDPCQDDKAYRRVGKVNKWHLDELVAGRRRDESPAIVRSKWDNGDRVQSPEEAVAQ